MALRIPGPTSPVQKALKAGDAPIDAVGFRFWIGRVAFDTTAMGFVLENLGPKAFFVFVEFELLSGDRDDFMNLPVLLTDKRGTRTKPVAVASGRAMKMLASMIIRSGTFHYQPGDAKIAWAYVIQNGEGGFSLTFPTGEVIDLASLIKDTEEQDQEMVWRSRGKRS